MGAKRYKKGSVFRGMAKRSEGVGKLQLRRTFQNNKSPRLYNLKRAGLIKLSKGRYVLTKKGVRELR